jgi:hypothetical protein
MLFLLTRTKTTVERLSALLLAHVAVEVLLHGVLDPLPGNQEDGAPADVHAMVGDGLVPGRDRFSAVKVLASDGDEVGVGGEGFAEGPAVGFVPASFETPDQFGGYTLCSLGHILSCSLEISVG